MTESETKLFQPLKRCLNYVKVISTTETCCI